MVKVWDSGGVPRATGQRTRLESVEVAGKVGDNRFHDIIREKVRACRPIRGSTFLWRPFVESPVVIGVSPMPRGSHHASREDFPYDVSGRGQSHLGVSAGGHT